MAQINLLPIDLSPARSSLKVASSLRKISFILTGVVLFFGLLGVAYILFLRIQIGNSQKNQKVITQNISNLEKTEQQLFLTRDRLGKIATAYAFSDKSDAFVKINKLVTELPQNIVVYSVTADSNKTQFSVLGKDSLSMAQFLNSVVLDKDLTTLSLVSFVFSPEKGYLITLEIS